MNEKWSVVEEFPTYKISNFGEVLNYTTGRLMRQSHSQSGVLKVGLVSGGRQYTQVVKILVADAFVFGRTIKHNTPIHLDTDQDNVRADNLVWRERGFAWLYSQQFEFSHNAAKPIRDITADIWYESVVHAAMVNGLLIKDIGNSLYKGVPVEYTNQIFSWR